MFLGVVAARSLFCVRIVFITANFHPHRLPVPFSVTLLLLEITVFSGGICFQFKTRISLNSDLKTIFVCFEGYFSYICKRF